MVQYGVCTFMVELIQRLGRAARDGQFSGLFLLMYEGWAHDEKIPAVAVQDREAPIRLITKPKPSKQERTSHAMLELVQMKDCIRQFFAEYLNDDTLTGM